MRRRTNYLLPVLLLFSLCGCDGFLDIEPVSSATDENFWKTEPEANAAAASMYALLRRAFNHANGIGFYAYGDLPSDEFASSDSYPLNDVVRMNWALPVPASDQGNAMFRLRRYDVFYQAIDQANRVLHNLPGMDAAVFDGPDTRDHYLGEAYFVRAFAYFYLSRIWGGVPLLTEAVAPIEAENHPAAAETAVLAQSRADVARAIELLRWDNVSVRDFAVRANKGAAYALLAHLSAWTKDYQTCLAAADSVLESGKYAFVSRDSLPYRNMYKGRSAEGIFEISQNESNEGTDWGIGRYTLVAPYYRLTVTPRLSIAPSHITALFADGDKRLNSAFDLTLSPDYAICTKYANVSYSNETANAVPIFKNNIVVFRYSDVKLLLAEALAATNRPARAEALLNEIRTQAGLPAWAGGGSLIEEIFDERARELFLEGHRFYDLVRLNRNFGVFRFPDTKMTASQFGAKKQYWPFDPSLLNSNPQLRQTPYWGTVNM